MSEHVLTEYGTTTCPVEQVRANVDDGMCSACGAAVTGDDRQAAYQQADEQCPFTRAAEAETLLAIVAEHREAGWKCTCGADLTDESDVLRAAGYRRTSPAPSGAEAALAEAWRRGWDDRDDLDPIGCMLTVEQAGCPNPYGDPWCRGCNPSGNSPYPPCERHSEPGGTDCEVPGCGPTSACSIGCENAYLALAPSGDEREALAEVIAAQVWRIHGPESTDEESAAMDGQDIADAVLAAGYRRTDSPTPSGAKAALEPLANDARMDAYYYSFDRTGLGPVDRILSVLAHAGKGYHHTSDWQDEYDYDYGPIRKGESAADAIQRVANESAAELRRALAPSAGPDTTDDWPTLSPRVCTQPNCPIPRKPGRPMHGPHDFIAGGPDTTEGGA